MKIKTISKVCALGLLLSAAVCKPVAPVYANDKTVIETGNYALMAYSAANAIAQIIFRKGVLQLITEGFSIATPWMALINLDVAAIAVDLYIRLDSEKKHWELSDDVDQLQAAVREIGGSEELEDEIAEKMFDPQGVEILTLKNVGLEALEGVGGSSAPITFEEILSAAGLIQQGFKTSFGGLSASTISSACSQFTGEQRTQCEQYASSGVASASSSMTDEQRSEYIKRRTAHLQYTGTAGATRADMSTGLVAAGRADEETLFSYIGAGETLIGNTKVLAGLDLILAQRLNLFNMLQGQQTANEAAIALQFVQEK